MFGALPNLFDRNFIVGYILPVAAFAAVSYGLITGFGYSPPWLPTPSENVDLANTTVTILAVWLLAVLLLAVNRFVYMALEGYGRYNPARLFAWKEKRRYKKIAGTRLDLDNAYLKSEDADILLKRDKLWDEEVEYFPPGEDYILPTRFGNAMRAFEYYPFTVYGIDPINGWIRLLAVIPKDYQQITDDAKAQTDFWLNLWAISVLSLTEYAVLAIDQGPRMAWFPPLAILFGLLASWGARKSAIEWGVHVKAAFDVFLPDLGAKLGFPSPINSEEERKLWEAFSDVINFHYREGLDEALDEIIGTQDDSSDANIASITRGLARRLASAEPEIARLIQETLHEVSEQPNRSKDVVPKNHSD